MSFAVLCLALQVSMPAIQVRIDPRVELLTAAFRLAEADEFNMSASKSPYSDRLDAYLRPYKDHPAIKMTHQLRDDEGIGFDSVAWLAVHIDGISHPKLIPGAHKADWKGTWKRPLVDKYLPLLSDFVRDTKFEAFLKSEEPHFKESTKSLEALLARKPVAVWLQDFFGAAPDKRSYAIVGMLCGGGNYGVSFRYANEEIVATPVLGASEFNPNGFPEFGEGSLGLILHEFSHPYVNHVVADISEIGQHGNVLYNLTKATLQSNAYEGGEVTTFETFTRAAENIMLQKWAPQQAENNMLIHRGKGFLWESDVTDALKEASQSGKSLKERIRRVVPVLRKLAKNPQQLLDRCPKAKSLKFSEPDSEGVTTVVIEFDQAMNPTSRGLIISPDKFTIVRKTIFDSEGRHATVGIRLQKSLAYQFAFNPFGSGYASASGYPMQPDKRTYVAEK